MSKGLFYHRTILTKRSLLHALCLASLGSSTGQARAHGVTRWRNQQVLIRKVIKEVWQTVFLWVFMKSLRGEEST